MAAPHKKPEASPLEARVAALARRLEVLERQNETRPRRRGRRASEAQGSDLALLDQLRERDGRRYRGRQMRGAVAYGGAVVFGEARVPLDEGASPPRAQRARAGPAGAGARDVGPPRPADPAARAAAAAPHEPGAAGDPGGAPLPDSSITTSRNCSPRASSPRPAAASTRSPGGRSCRCWPCWRRFLISSISLFPRPRPSSGRPRRRRPESCEPRATSSAVS